MIDFYCIVSAPYPSLILLLTANIPKDHKGVLSLLLYWPTQHSPLEFGAEAGPVISSQKLMAATHCSYRLTVKMSGL